MKPIQSLLVLAIMLFSMNLFAQDIQKMEPTFNYNVEVGKDDKTTKKTSISQIIGEDDEFIWSQSYSYKRFKNRSAFYITKYDKSLNPVKTVEGRAEYKGKKLSIREIFMMQDEIIILYTYFNKSEKTRYIYTQSFDKKKMRFSKEFKIIAKFDEPKKFLSRGRIDIKFSEDGSKLGIIYSLPYDKREKEKFGAIVFDANLNELWSREMTLPYLDKFYTLEYYYIGNDGKIYVQGIHYKTEKARLKRSGKPNYNYKIFVYGEDKSDFLNFQIRLKDKFITDMKMGMNNENELICAGFYSDKGHWSIKGTFYAKVDKKSGELEEKSFKEFPEDFIMEELSERQKKRVKKGKRKVGEMYEYDLDELVLTNDGGVVLIAEQYYVTEHTTSHTDANGVTTYTTTYYYHYNDIIAAFVNSNGSIEWLQRIPKHQTSTNDGGYKSSYSMVVTPTYIYFVFNDFMYGAEGRMCGNTCSGFGSNKIPGAVGIARLDLEGNMDMGHTYQVYKQQFWLVPKTYIQIDDYNIIIKGEGRKKKNLVRFTFEE